MSSCWQKWFSLSSSVSRYSYCKCARTKSRATSRVRMCSREWARRLRRFSRSMARYTMRENRRSEEHTSELQSQSKLVCRLLLEKKKKIHQHTRVHTRKVHTIHDC